MTKLLISLKFAFLVLGLAPVSCNKSTVVTAQSPMEQYEANYTKWQSGKLKNYAYTQTISCFCAHSSPYKIVVKNSAISSATNNKGESLNTTVAAAHNFSGIKTIEQQFESIKTSLQKKPAEVKIKYNTQYGYPESVYIDFVKNMADEEMSFSVSDFKAK